MAAHLTDESLWAAGLGARLRVLQASFADDEAATRCGYLTDEVENALREVPPTRRRAYLDALKEQFPLEGAGTAFTPVPAQLSETATSSTTTLVGRLAKMAAGLSPAGKQILLRDLARAGLAVQVEVPAAAEAAPTPAPPPPPAATPVPAELQKKLGLDASQTLDDVRVLRMISVLVDLTVTLDQIAWQVWKNLAPNSRVRRDPGATGDLRKIAGPYLTGDNEVSTAQISQLLDKTRQLIAGLLAAVGATGEAFARQYLTRFSPQAIKDAADAEPGFFIGPEQKCWRKYTELFNEISGVTIENEIANAIVKYTEDLILGGTRPPGGTGGGA